MFPFGSRLTPPSRLPRPIPPFPGETTTSYLHRLGIANQLQPGDLRAHLTGTRQRVPVTLDGLAAATGKSPRGLSYALPELRPGTPPGADPVLPAHVRRTICWRCAARRGVFGFATIWQPAEVNICRSHLIWLGSAVRAGRGQHSVGHCPRSSEPSDATAGWPSAVTARQPLTRSPRQPISPLCGLTTDSTVTGGSP